MEREECFSSFYITVNSCCCFSQPKIPPNSLRPISFKIIFDRLHICFSHMACGTVLSLLFYYYALQ